MKIEDILQWLRINVTPGADLHTDSRKIKLGDVFIAYVSNGIDNRIYINDAVENGAGAVLWQDNFDISFNLKLVKPKVPSLKLERLDVMIGPIASAWYNEPSKVLDIVGITGTNGKTSCSLWIAYVLNMIARRCAVIGTLGNGFPEEGLKKSGFTTPDAAMLQRSLHNFVQQGARAVAMEVSSHALHQGRVNGIHFNITVFTNLTQDHLDYHGDFYSYEAAKTILFDYPGVKTAVINADSPMGQRLIVRLCTRFHKKIQIIAYGLEQSGHINKIKRKIPEMGCIRTLIARDIHSIGYTTIFEVDGSWGSHRIQVPIFGTFNVSNLLAVIGTLLSLKVQWQPILESLLKLPTVPGRMQRFGGNTQNGEPLVIIDFAHTPDALREVLLTLRPLVATRSGRLIVVFGCGGNRDPIKRPKMGEIASEFADKVVLTNDNPRDEIPAVIIDQIISGIPDAKKTNIKIIEDRSNAILETVFSVLPEDVIVIAGKGHESTQEISGCMRPFSDYECVTSAISSRARRNQ